MKDTRPSLLDFLACAVRRALLPLLALFGWLATTSNALAQDAQPSAESHNGTWIMAYAVVIIVLVAGLALILRPSTRRDRPQHDQIDED